MTISFALLLTGALHPPHGPLPSGCWGDRPKGRGVRGTRRLDPNLYGSRPASRARCLALTPGPGLGPAAGASDEAQRLVLADRPRVPRAAPGPGHAFPGAAPVPSHVTTPRDSRPSGGQNERDISIVWDDCQQGSADSD